MEKTFLMIKPDAVQRNLIGTIIQRFENKGFKLIAAKFMQVSNDLAETHYSEHKGKPFFNELVEFITSGPVFSMVWEGQDIIQASRKMIGVANPQESEVGTIRGDYGMIVRKNIIHGSDSIESAKREINLFFRDEDLIEYDKDGDLWIY